MTEKNIIKWDDNILTRQQAIPGNERIFGLFNKAWISGRIERDFEFSHTESGRVYYKTRVVVKRLSGAEDFVPIVVPKIILTNFQSLEGKFVEVGGQFRSYRRWDNYNHRHTDLFLFTNFFHVCNSPKEFRDTENANMVYLDGNICRTFLKRNVSGKDINDLLLVVSRGYDKDDYIPCVAWGSVARTKSLKANARIKCYGRIQSRKYVKKSLTNYNTRVYGEAYEVSIMSMKIIK